MTALILQNLVLALAVVSTLALVCRLPYRFAADERAGLRLARAEPGVASTPSERQSRSAHA